MKKETNILEVKNMVCNRCIKVVKQTLDNNVVKYNKVTLGIVYLTKEISKDVLQKLNRDLKKEGFELIQSNDSKIINKVKTTIIEIIHQGKSKPISQNFSDFLENKIGMDYSNISRLFSDKEEKTVEQYIIEQKIERVKELLTYNELTLSQISYELDYSSPQHLSKQFKKVTGITPTQFKKTKNRTKLDTI